MSKVLVIPDVHLKTKIFDRAAKILDSGQADFAVQLGDIVDDWSEEYNFALYERTMRKAIEFAEKYPKTLWCMGNHDYGYHFPTYGRRETGHSQMQEEPMLRLLKEFGDRQKIIYRVDNVIFSHAGLSIDYLRGILLDEPSEIFGDYEETLVNESEGDELWRSDSPIWFRPEEARLYAFGDDKYLQVVGHSPVEEIHTSDNVLLTDVFSTYRNGAPIGEQRFAIVDTVNKTWKYAEEDE